MRKRRPGKTFGSIMLAIGVVIEAFLIYLALQGLGPFLLVPILIFMPIWFWGSWRTIRG